MSCPPRMAGCRVSCLHRQLVEGYRLEREHYERTAEREALGYTAELADFRATNPPVTFCWWLQANRRERAA